MSTFLILIIEFFFFSFLITVIDPTFPFVVGIYHFSFQRH